MADVKAIDVSEFPGTKLGFAGVEAGKLGNMPLGGGWLALEGASTAFIVGNRALPFAWVEGWEDSFAVLLPLDRGGAVD